MNIRYACPGCGNKEAFWEKQEWWAPLDYADHDEIVSYVEKEEIPTAEVTIRCDECKEEGPARRFEEALKRLG